MSSLDDLVEPLKRAVSVPGGFDALFPNSSTEDLVARSLDGLAEAQLDGFLRDFEVDDEAYEVIPDLTTPGGSLTPAGVLVMIYVHYQFLRNELLNRRNRVKYQAGSAVFEEDQTASMLNELLRQAKARLDDLLARAERGEMDSSGAIVLDMAFIRATTDYGVGVHPLEAWGR